MERELARQLLETERMNADRIAGDQQRHLAEGAEEIVEDLLGDDSDQADGAAETYEREQALTILRMEQDRIDDIDLALAKVAWGRYGRCETCGDQIAEERLLAEPAARFCAPHQRDWELRRLLFEAPAMSARGEDSREPGWQELADLPDEEDAAFSDLSAEEQALHEEVTGDRVSGLE